MKLKLVPILLYIILSTLMVTVWWTYENKNVGEYRTIAQSLSEQIAMQVQDNISIQMTNAESFRDILIHDPINSSEDFADKLKGLIGREKGFHSITYIDNDGRVQYLHTFEQPIWPSKSLVSDQGSQSINATLLLAQNSGDIAISPVFHFDNGEKGYIIIYPLLDEDENQGFLVYVINAYDMIKEYISVQYSSEFIFYVDDLENEIFNSGNNNPSSASEILGSYSIPVFDRFWTIYIALSPTAISELLSLTSKIILVIGLFVTFWISWTVKKYLDFP